MTYKICPACEQKLERITDFYSSRVKGGGRRTSAYCRKCESARNNRRHKIRRRETMAEVHNYLATKSCVDCGTVDPRVLEFDHRDPKLKRGNIGDMIGSLTWRTVATEIAKCDVRCANCHRIKTAELAGYYQYEPAAPRLH